MTDIAPIDAPAPPTADTPFVRVYLDRDTGRAVIALDRDAVDALVRYLDDIGPGYDLSMNPGHYGLSDDDGPAVSAVISRISGPLARLYR